MKKMWLALLFSWLSFLHFALTFYWRTSLLFNNPSTHRVLILYIFWSARPRGPRVRISNVRQLFFFHFFFKNWFSFFHFTTHDLLLLLCPALGYPIMDTNKKKRTNNKKEEKKKRNNKKKTIICRLIGFFFCTLLSFWLFMRIKGRKKKGFRESVALKSGNGGINCAILKNPYL